MSTDIVNVTNHSKNTILIGKYVNNHNNDRKNITIFVIMLTSKHITIFLLHKISDPSL